MRVLVVTAQQRLPDLTRVYECLAEQLSIVVVCLERTQQCRLRQALAHLDLTSFQRILLDLPFRNIQRQTTYLAGLRGLVLYEEDACQNYLKKAPRRGQFSFFYSCLPQARVIVTGARLATRLQAEGVAATFVSKGFNASTLYVEDGPRDIELGFIGRTSSSSYEQRAKLLRKLALVEPLQQLRTKPGAAYRRMLNRIRVFVSADIGLDEYMAKNFEAMACGCAVVAWRQGEEEAAIGLQEGKHLLLYSSLGELLEQLARLRNEPGLVEQLAQNGRAFVEQHLSYETLAAALLRVLQQPPLPMVAPAPWWRRWFR